MIQNTKIASSFAAVLIVVAALGMASYVNTQRLIRNNDWVVHTHEVSNSLERVLSLLKDAETGQRGFILTGKDSYLTSYDQAEGSIKDTLAELTDLTYDDPVQSKALVQLRSLAGSKLDELKRTVTLRRQSGQDAAMQVILTDRGENIMNDIRDLVMGMQKREQHLLLLWQEASAASARRTMWTVAVSIPLSLIALAIAAIVLTRSGRRADLVVGPPVGDNQWHKIAARYAFAVIVVVLASLLRVWLLKSWPMPLFITYYPSVLLVAMVSGGGPGIVATILSGLIVSYYFTPPYGQWAIETPGDIIALTIFAGTSLSLSVLAERLRNSRWSEAFGLAKLQEAEELAQKNEELAQQAEELSQQSEELAQQNEELQSQAEQIQLLNTELMGREEMLRRLLEAARLQSTQESVLTEVCGAAKNILGTCAAAVVICERRGNELFIRAHAGFRKTPGPWPLEGAFPWLVMQEKHTACLNDASLRPDLKLLQIPDMATFQSALSTPLLVRAETFGAVTVYGHEKQEWTEEQFRLIEWLATQCGHILETLQLQDQLRWTAEQNRLLSDLLERSDQPFGIGYPNGTLGYVNSAFERLTGYTHEELKGMDWANALTPPQWRSIERTKLEELNRTGQPVRYEKEYLRKDGTHVPIELLVHLIKDASGLPLHYYSFITDISARKKAEAELQSVSLQRQVALDAARLGWWHYDPSGGTVAWDARFQEIWGVSGPGLLIDEILKCLHPDDLAGMWAKVEEALNPADPKSYSAEYRIIMPDGSMKWIEAHGIAAFEGSGPHRRAVSLVGTVADITERKLAEESLATAKDELEQRVVERTAELAHRAAQLRALTGELTLAEQRERSRLAKVLHDHLQQLLVAAKFRLAILGKGTEDLMRDAIKEVEQLIDESIASSRSLTAELSPPILYESGLNAGLEWLAKRMADRQGLWVDLELVDVGPLPDDLKILLFESVRELLFNIAKHAHTRSAVINLKQVDSSLQLTVSDQGIGFDPVVLSMAGVSGKGFGLFSVRERLELFGGTMEIQSAPGQGSRVFLTVPMPQGPTLQATLTQVVRPQEISIPEVSAASGLDRKIRILLVDDHAVVRRGIGSMLSNERDIEIVGEAADGQEAVVLAQALKPEVILMDVSMPNLSGVEATRIIHGDFPDIRIIGLSMFHEDEQAAAMLQAGAVHYVSKSRATEVLINAIRSSMC